MSDTRIEVERFANCKAKFLSRQNVVDISLDEPTGRSVETYSLSEHATAKLAFVWETESGALKIILSKEGLHTAEQAVRAEARAAIGHYLDRVIGESHAGVKPDTSFDTDQRGI